MSFLRERSEGWCERKKAASCLLTSRTLGFFASRFELCEELLSRAALPGKILLITPPNVVSDPWVLELQVILELVNVHDGGNGDAVLFEDEVLLVEVDPLDQGSEIYAGLGNGEALDHSR